MARFNRVFLIPYLEDVCALYMADLEICAKMVGLQNEILILQGEKDTGAPAKPEYEECFGCFASIIGNAGILIICLLMLGFVADMSASEDGWGSTPHSVFVFLVIVESLLGLVVWRLFAKPEWKARKHNKELNLQYKKAMRQYQIERSGILAQNEKGRKNISGMKKQMRKLSAERDRVAQTLSKVYAANIIPSYYRDMYAAVYLYDFFSTSRSDDLDMALNTYVLEQIKDKLDVIIEKQHSSILNQRLILANQQKSLEEQRAHNAYMRQKIYQIASSIEEQNQYLAMLESNTAATAYFAAANYLR